MRGCNGAILGGQPGLPAPASRAWATAGPSRVSCQPGGASEKPPGLPSLRPTHPLVLPRVPSTCIPGMGGQFPGQDPRLSVAVLATVTPARPPPRCPCAVSSHPNSLDTGLQWPWLWEAGTSRPRASASAARASPLLQLGPTPWAAPAACPGQRARGEGPASGAADAGRAAAPGLAGPGPGRSWLWPRGHPQRQGPDLSRGAQRGRPTPAPDTTYTPSLFRALPADPTAGAPSLPRLPEAVLLTCRVSSRTAHCSLSPLRSLIYTTWKGLSQEH